ncbi:MAG TPA: hypothetical protein VMR34_02215 [Candidatus Saccharimonadales bacterium]|nr:hypothetical protein [Candidatus Saccharimonadales bacterium]
MTPHQIKKIIERTKASIIGIAGPTPNGYVFLESYKIALPTKPIITNILTMVDLTPFAKTRNLKKTDSIVDAADMPYGSHTVGMILVSSLSKTSHINGTQKLHLAFLNEAKRVLAPGGVLLMAFSFKEDKNIGLSIGLNLIYENDNEDYTLVFRS